ncbi:MAG: endonuclease V [Methanomicrobia archaeon]|nr:endonuclease V [Methanomicrobia archaeon]
MYEVEFFQLLKNPDLKELRKFQVKIAKNIKPQYGETGEIYGADVAYKGDKAVGALVSKTSESYEIKEVNFPYIPTYFAFRELPILWHLIKNCDDCIIFDGNGVLHPCKAGLATMAGVMLEKQTIGAAKSLLCGEIKGDYVYQNKEIIGKIVKSSKNPIYVSIGNNITLEQASEIVLNDCIYRVPEVLRKAHILATHIAKRI